MKRILCLLFVFACLAQTIVAALQPPIVFAFEEQSWTRTEEESPRAELAQFLIYNPNTYSVTLSALGAVNGSATGKGFEYSGCQLALAAHPTSYIGLPSPIPTVNTGRIVSTGWYTDPATNTSVIGFEDKGIPFARGLVLQPQVYYTFIWMCASPPFDASIPNQAVQTRLTSVTYQRYERVPRAFPVTQGINPIELTGLICSQEENEVRYLGAEPMAQYTLPSRDAGAWVSAFKTFHTNPQGGGYSYGLTTPYIWYGSQIGLNYFVEHSDPSNPAVGLFSLHVTDPAVLPPPGTYEGTIKLSGLGMTHPCTRNIPLTLTIP